MNKLELLDVEVSYGRGRSALKAAEGVTFTIPPGRTVGLVGESGSGKSSIAKAIVGLAPVTRGRILLGERDITNATRQVRKAVRQSIQLVFQDPYSSLNPRMTVGEMLDEAISAHHNLAREDRYAEIRRLLDLVALESQAMMRYPHQFSGGQRQRIAIARALAVKPDVIIADEITSSLDVSVQATVLNMLRHIQREEKLSMLFISHDLAVVRYMSEEITVLHLGQIVEAARRDDLFTAPKHPYTRSLLDSVPVLSRRALNGMGLPSGDPPDPHDPPPGCRFHPRCPVGPEAYPDRRICREVDPQAVALSNPHNAACHFPVGVERTAGSR